MARPKAQLGRREFLAAGATAAASVAFGRPPSKGNTLRDRSGPWIPADDFMAELPRLMEVVSLPGLAMATVEDGEVIWTRAVGVTNVETRAPVRADTMFEAASLSKPVFAYVVLKLADEKRIDLDRPLVEYRRPDYLPAHPHIDLITARDVLRHSTGLPNWRNRPEDSLVPAFKPGSRFRYSGEGFFWLQLVSAPSDLFKLPQNLLPNVAGSLGTTVSEYARFMTLMMDRPRRAAWEILERSRRAMLSRQIMRKADVIYWGLSWGLEAFPSGLAFWHGGNNAGIFKTFALGDPARRRAIVIFTNGGGGDRVYQRIVRAATGRDLLEFMLI
jgi:CubicO group peptidase (beta-lactamase class C family)